MLTIPTTAARTGFDVAGRVLSALAVTGLLLGAPGLTPAALAQAEQVGIDPPGRVGRLARLTGTVSFHTAEQTEWQPASLNFPVTSGQAYWTEPAASAEIEIGGSRVVLDHGTEIDLEKLDDHTFSATLPQGNLYLALTQMDPGDSVTLRTPRGTVTLGQAGRSVVETGDTAQPTAGPVLDGRHAGLWPGLVSAGGSRLGAVSAWALGVCDAVGLDLGGRCTLGLRAVPLWPLGAVWAALGLDSREL